ncbi:hypothetical protein, conserved [Cyanidioschyzon merolae strain 10D]|jgi:hypothetical protein|uniref:DOT1 domain-containing protein n=1 Tax=Cyanidioschyzon merolae (strain NIES-3377 / 10D) TaxID=280699 RepID=M1UXL3_CYAM1|nr:hypothetical protein, conserved [Cyanidioschyzon merolae strain 10D]BAM83231.1 hypothetical protein, conserved [Cyanidioschyzon merolae strain 10D]|eukprot:XP_005539267.1 hypothetical protein, conserved [Cyanidioschyzon merolae strain 10D]
MPLEAVKVGLALFGTVAGALGACSVPFLFTRWPYVATTNKALCDLREILKPLAKPTASFLDIGSGDGSVVELAAMTGFGSSLGIESNPVLAFYSKWRLRKLRNATCLWGRYQNMNFSGIDTVYVYGGEQIMTALGEKLTAELKPGATIVCNSFPLPKPENHIGKRCLFFIRRAGSLYIYRVQN